MNLRAYQSEGSDAVIEQWKEVNSTLGVLPTGGGKTIIFADIIKRMQPNRAMVIAHREELIWQARDKIQKFAGLQCGIEMADLFVNNSLFGETPVVISTIQTQISGLGDRRRMSRFNPKDFGVLVIDEAHHGTANSYKDLINYYKTHNPQIKILGVTATPDRADEEALGQIFESVAFDFEILDLIHWGWLVPVDQLMVTVGTLDFSHVRTTAGDLNGADLAAVMEAEENIQGVVQPTVEAMFGLPCHALDGINPSEWWAKLKDVPHVRRAIVFTVSVAQAEALSNIFNRLNSELSRWVCGTTNKDVRRDTLEQFASGKVKCIVNVGVLTEGFDDPGVEMIVMARPTKSRALYAQCCGRAMRPLPGVVDGLDTNEQRKEAIAGSAKKSMLILDFVGNSGKHKLMSSGDILGGKVSDEAVERAIRMAKKNGMAVRMDEALDEAEEQLRKEAEARRLAEEARKAKLLLGAKYTTCKVSAFELFELSPIKERGWDSGKTLSTKQRALLLRQGINPDELKYSEAKQLINEMFRRWDKKLATPRQCGLLRKHGYTQTHDLRLDDAKAMIDALAQNHWRKPENWGPPKREAVPF